MQIFYEGSDITDFCVVSDADYRDVSGDKMDSLDITFQESGKWTVWNPAINDSIRVMDGACDTGTMYVNAVVPEGAGFRIIAAAAKTNGRNQRRNAYIGKTIGQIMALCAGECGMGWRIYGLDENTPFQYLQREKESAAAFLSRIGALEGAVLKTYSGRLTMIGIEAAQNLMAIETLNITPGMDGVRYTRQNYNKRERITVSNPFLSVSAWDSGAQGCGTETVNLPTADKVTAGRWARGYLLSKNRTGEMLEIECQFRGNWTAMRRIDVTGGTEADGEWIIDSVRHDFVQKTSLAELRRVIRTVK